MLFEKAQEDASIFTAVPDSIKGWLESTISGLPPLITEVPHPLASSPAAEVNEKSSTPEKVSTLKELPSPTVMVKEEPLLPECGDATPSLANFTIPQLQTASPSSEKHVKISLYEVSPSCALHWRSPWR